MSALTSLRRSLWPAVYRRLPGGVQRAYAAARFGPRHQKPNTAYIETTSACNLNCVMCPTQRPAVKAHKPSAHLDVDLFRRLIDEIVADVPTITTLYLHKDGEPLLHPRIVEMIDYAASRHGNVVLVTNATMLDEPMARAILATPLQQVRFSVDGLTRETFEKIRIQLPTNEFAGDGVDVGFHAVMRNVQRFLALREDSGSRVKVGIRTTEFKPTAGEITAYRAHWLGKVDFVDVAGLISWSGMVSKEADEQRQPCIAPWSAVVISANGHLVACCTYVSPTASGKGRLFDLNHGTLDQALRSEGRKALMRAQLDGNLAEEAPYCVPCRDWRATEIPALGRRWSLALLRRVAR
ncbi:MAG: radical SAM/SPASM domain-containing protein [Vicinamibacterales bacterium]